MPQPYILGLDLGTNSLGWAMIGLDKPHIEGGRPNSIIDLGVRIFPAGVDGTATDIEAGKEESKNTKRREARQHRRQLWRRKRRKEKLFNRLQEFGLLPSTESNAPKDRSAMFAELDKGLFLKYIDEDISDSEHDRQAHLLPYILRAKGLDEKLEPHAFGRALYHLGQRRGYLSNALEEPDADSDKEQGVVLGGISELQEAIDKVGARTLGEYFATIDPEKRRIRVRWTARQMFEDEFQLLWGAQANFYPELLTDQMKSQIQTAIFFQRPLKSQKGKIAKCELEPHHPRCSKARPEAQEFIYLQKVNDLRLINRTGKPAPHFELGERERFLTRDERDLLISELHINGGLSFTEVRKLLCLNSKIKFNLEAGGEKRLPGNTTYKRMSKWFKSSWATMLESERVRITDDILSVKNQQHRAKRAHIHGLNPYDAQDFADKFRAPAGHLNLSLKAIKKLLPSLREGTPFTTAKRDCYPPKVSLHHDLLPPVWEQMKHMTNPTVFRCLTEIRRVVNSLVREYGMPDKIHIELARDLKRSRGARAEMSKRMRLREKERQKAEQKCIAKGILSPRRRDIEKVLLAEECEWVCPYTGRRISMDSLMGAQAQFDIEHIIPYSRCFNNSFANKTLCWNDENRNVKRAKTPYEAYSGHEERWEEMIDRVASFRGGYSKRKLKLFTMPPNEVAELLEGFTSRQLNDTRYASKLAQEYLGTLYGAAEGNVGVTEGGGTGRKVIVPIAGGVTAIMRRALNLNGLLNQGKTMKSRDDHRHHTVDAVTVALADAGVVRSIAIASRAREDLHNTIPLEIDEPWVGFLHELRGKLDDVYVSFRPDHRLSGALHKETNYGKVWVNGDKQNRKLVVRKPVTALSKKEIGSILDPVVQAAVVAALGAGKPDKVFADLERLPKHPNGTTIRRVRVEAKAKVLAIGDDERLRWNAGGSNHHIELYKITDKRGKVKWGCEVVSMFEAYERLAVGDDVVCRDHGEGTEFLFSLMNGDTVQFTEGAKAGEVWVMVKNSKSSAGRILFGFIKARDSRMRKAQIETGDLWTPGPSSLMRDSPIKVHVLPNGQLRRSGG
jgi:CRISPR-associated endonuclease Csn1